MSINIVEAIKAMNEGKIVKRMLHDIFGSFREHFYRKSSKSGYFDVSNKISFENLCSCSVFSEEEIESDWEIIIPESETRPCIWCGGETHVHEWKTIGGFTISCSNPSCTADSKCFSTKKQAICQYNDMYDLLKIPVKNLADIKDEFRLDESEVNHMNIIIDFVRWMIMGVDRSAVPKEVENSISWLSSFINKYSKGGEG